MRLAYLLNSYPMTSTTFIRREIVALEKAGQPVKRLAVRHWHTPLVEPADLAEQQQTTYLLTGNVGGLFRNFLSELFCRPIAVLRVLPAWWELWRAARGGLVQHVGYLLEAIQLRRWLKQSNIEHVHAHFSTNAAGVAMLAHLLGGPGYSFTVHGPDELVDPKRNAMRLKAAHARAIIAITAYCRGRILAEAPDAGAKVHIIPCGLDLADLPQNPTPPGQSNTLVCVGRLCPQKAQVLISEAVAAVRGEFPEMRVVLIGDGESRAEVEAAIARHGVGDIVSIAGWKPNKEVHAALASARAFLLPSFAEGLPVVIMEAMALGRPVLTTRIAGIPELVDAACGWVITPGAHDELVEALRRAMRADSKQLAEMGSEGRRRVEERHDLQKIAPKLLALFRSFQ